jgi:hypothetical protein
MEGVNREAKLLHNPLILMNHESREIHEKMEQKSQSFASFRMKVGQCSIISRSEALLFRSSSQAKGGIKLLWRG